MKNRVLTHAVRVGSAVMVGVSCLCLPALADQPSFSEQPTTPHVASPHAENLDDVISSVPIIGKIPRAFFFGGDYQMKLTGMELQINHIGSTDSVSAVKAHRIMISLTWASPIAFFGSEVDLPIFRAETLQLSNWGLSPMGDYVVHLSKDAAPTPWVGLTFTARI